MEPIFFEIPIYRTSKATFNLEIENIIDKKINQYPTKQIGEHFENYKLLILNNYSYPWNYNEIVGYLNLYIFGNQLRIDFWYITNKRISRSIQKKRFINFRKTYEAKIDVGKSSIEIFNWILEQLEDLKNNKKSLRKDILI